jgi:hypothetical protein
MSAESPPRPAVSPAAVVSLVLGLLSPFLSLVAAVPAFLVGLRALRAINRSDGRLCGAGLAVAGMALGAVAGIVTGVGVVLIAVNRLDATRDRVECANHLRSLGLAVGIYHDRNDNVFPAATATAPDLRAEMRLSWLATLLPYFGADTPAGQSWKDLAGRLDPRQPWDSPANDAVRARVPLFLCRAFPESSRPVDRGLTSYVGVTGVDPDAASLPRTNSRAGFFGYGRRITDTDLMAGSSHTLIAIETRQDNGPWSAGGRPTVRGLDPDESRYLGPGRPFGGLHANGANALYADAAVHFLHDTMAPPELRAEATLVGHASEGAE